MGALLLAQGGREKEAIEVMQKSCVIFSGTTGDDAVFRNQARHIEAWDDAIKALNSSISVAENIEDKRDSCRSHGQSCQVMGQTYLEQYCTADALVASPQQKALSYSINAIKLDYIKLVTLDLAQKYFLLDEMDDEHCLNTYMDTTMKRGPSLCQACHQSCEKDGSMAKCSGCKVARYCSRAHQEQAWKRSRVYHKVLCPLLNGWGRMKDKEKDDDESCRTLCSNFFDSIVVSGPAKTSSDVANVDEQHAFENVEVTLSIMRGVIIVTRSK